MASAGYSRTPLVQKLGIREGFRIAIIGAPEDFLQLLHDLPSVQFLRDKRSKKNFIHYFETKKEKLERDILFLKSSIEQDGMIWISWPKKSSGMKTDITEDVIRDIALRNGLVDVKVCAVDEVWSGLKLVIPLKERKK